MKRSPHPIVIPGHLAIKLTRKEKPMPHTYKRYFIIFFLGGLCIGAGLSTPTHTFIAIGMGLITLAALGHSYHPIDRSERSQNDRIRFILASSLTVTVFTYSVIFAISNEMATWYGIVIWIVLLIVGSYQTVRGLYGCKF